MSVMHGTKPIFFEENPWTSDRLTIETQKKELGCEFWNKVVCSTEGFEDFKNICSFWYSLKMSITEPYVPEELFPMYSFYIVILEKLG